ncbi:MAG: ATP-dependent zinc metalloprotease FtsH [Candidatus Spechtbacterales bacterium]
MRKYFTKNIFTILLVVFAIAGFFALLSSPFEKPEEVSLSKLVDEINNGKISEISIEGNNLKITLADGAKQTSRKESESSLTESLANYGVNPEKLDVVDVGLKGESGFGYWVGVVIPFVLPFLIIGFFLWFMLRSAQRGTAQAFTFAKAKAKLFGPQGKKQDVTFKDVANAKEAKEELWEIVEFLKHPKKFLDMGARIPRGVLLMGAPGTGKTLLARAVSGEAGVPFFSIAGSEFVEMFVGVGAARARDLFETAKKHAPAIIFIDEIDAVGRLRGSGLGGGHDEREQTLNQILSEMDGFERDTNVIVMAATNRPDVLDPALLRPGRFDRRVVIDEPDINAREEILKIHARGKPIVKNANLRTVAERTPGFSGADLANLMNEAAILAARNNQKTISQNDLLISIEKVLLGPERKSHVYGKKEKEIAAYHEAGHALVANSLPHTDPVHKISIISRGRAAGYTLKMPIEDKHFRTKTEFVEELSVMLGGYAAEKMVFDELTTGASNDLQKASDLARKMVTQYGMSDKLGPVTFGDREELVFLGKEFGEQRNYSEGTAQEIDKEVSKFISNALKTAQKIIKEKRVKLDAIAVVLVEKETIERKEFEKMMAV